MKRKDALQYIQDSERAQLGTLFSEEEIADQPELILGFSEYGYREASRKLAEQNVDFGGT